jgi:4-hydroxybenzoate polyprenyltransferase
MPGQGTPAPPPSAVADRETGWIDRLPPRLRDYAVLARWDRPVGTWLLLLPCWWGTALAPGWPDVRLLALFAVGAVAMRGAGCAINDLADRDIDRRVARTRDRPLASGRLGAGEALAFAALQSLVGLGVLLCLNRQAALVALASVPLILAYPFMKRITWWPQAFLGITFNWGALVGYAAATGTLDAAALALYAAGITWTLGYDTIYAHQDKADDSVVGVRSTALRLGDATPSWLWGFYGTALLLLGLAGLLAGRNPIFYLGLVAAAVLLARQIEDIALDDPADCLERFRANRTVGLVVFAALVGGGTPAAAAAVS